jgi:uncharacterized membrane protein YfcA
MITLHALTLVLPALALGAGMGFFGGLFGIGGGVIAIPLLVLGYGMAQPLAQGTALVMMAPNLLVGWWRYSQRHPVAWRRALGIGVVASVTTWGVAHWATGLPTGVLRVAFSGFLLLLALRTLLALRVTALAAAGDANDANDADGILGLGRARVPLRWLPLVGVVGGGSMGLLGIGGGLVATPLITRWFGQRQTVAQSLSLALVAPSSVMALLTYAQAGQVDWGMGLPLAVSGMCTVSAGVALAHRLPERRMRAAFAWMLLCTGAWLLIGYARSP